MNLPQPQSIGLWIEQRLQTPDQAAIKFKDKNKNSWVQFSFFQYIQKIVQLRKILTQQGFQRNTKVALMSSTRWEWAALDVATIASHGILIPLYSNLSNEDILYILNHSEADILIVENETLKKQIQALQPQFIKNISLLVIEEIINDSFLEKSEQVNKSEIQEFLNQAHLLQPKAPITIIYTSGTTGQPKGVLMSQEALVSEVHEAFSLFAVSSKDTSLSFLPYAHVLGRIEHWGSYARGYQLAFAESIDQIKNNLLDVKPQFLIAVPRIFEKIYSGILNKVETSFLKKKLFQEALQVSKKMSYFRTTRQTPPLNLILRHEFLSQLVFAPIKKAFGNQLRFAISGGAPLSEDLGLFFSYLGIKILEGYGLTETFAAITVNTEANWQIGTVGKPIGDVKIRFADDGEILVHSKKNLVEYYKNPSATAEAFTSDGYFKTGDIGEFTHEGFLKITDRKKDLIKTAGGKYVAPQKIEGLLKLEPVISQVLVIGDQKKYVTALISCELTDENTDEIRDKIHRHIQTINSSLASYETIKKYEIIFDPWTVENGSLTPSMKVKRKVLESRYKDLIEKLYT